MGNDLHRVAVRVNDSRYTQVSQEIVWSAERPDTFDFEPVKCLIDVVRPDDDFPSRRARTNIETVDSASRFNRSRTQLEAPEAKLDVDWRSVLRSTKRFLKPEQVPIKADGRLNVLDVKVDLWIRN